MNINNHYLLGYCKVLSLVKRADGEVPEKAPAQGGAAVDLNNASIYDPRKAFAEGMLQDLKKNPRLKKKFEGRRYHSVNADVFGAANKNIDAMYRERIDNLKARRDEQMSHWYSFLNPDRWFAGRRINNAIAQHNDWLHDQAEAVTKGLAKQKGRTIEEDLKDMIANPNSQNYTLELPSEHGTYEQRRERARNVFAGYQKAQYDKSWASGEGTFRDHKLTEDQRNQLRNRTYDLFQASRGPSVFDNDSDARWRANILSRQYLQLRGAHPSTQQLWDYHSQYYR